MAILPLVVSPDPRLNVASALVAEVDDSVRRLMDDMLETMYHNDGIGLAAVQVGVHKRILVMDLRRSRVRYPDADGADAGEEEDGECGGGPYFMANPEIAFRSEEENVYPEGCLSFPGQRADVVRPSRVAVSFLDYDNRPQTLECGALLATCVQHEIDHLNGITFVDRLSRLKRDMILRKMKKMQRAATP